MFGLLSVVLTACGSREPAYTDNGNPGQIKAVAFYDDDKNGVMDSGETGAQIELGISQEVGCLPDKATSLTTDTNGAAVFDDLKPGKYCVAPILGDLSMTTKYTQEVFVSSDAVTTVPFGIVREE
jgi:uncharacterized protein (DUF2141 family)